MQHRKIPATFYVYEFSYPETMPQFAGVVFYVGKGTNLSRMDNHLQEAVGGHKCAKCETIRDIWDRDLIVTRRIVFETQSEEEAINEERRRILQHSSLLLTNLTQTDKPYVSPGKERQKRKKQPENNYPFDLPLMGVITEFKVPQSMSSMTEDEWAYDMISRFCKYNRLRISPPIPPLNRSE